jgi:carbamoylphosphate synthase large subunit
MKKKHIRFGEYYHWAPRILEFLDTSRFMYEFGPPDENRLAGIDAFVPLCLSDIQAMFGVSDKLSAKALIPTRDVLELADNKITFYQYLFAHGFGSSVPQIIETPTQYPIVAKMDFGSNGEGVWILHDDEQLASLLNTHQRENIVLSEYIPGSREFAFHFLAKHGEILWSGVVEHDHATSDATPYVRGQNGAVGTSVTCAEFSELNVLHAIIEKLGFTGTGCFDFKVLDGTPKIFELNPRPGYSIALWINQYLSALLTHLPQNPALAPGPSGSTLKQGRANS